MSLEDMLLVISEYKNIICQIPELTSRKGKSIHDIYQHIGISEKEWQIKVQEQNFTPEELKEIVLFLE